MEGRRSRSRSPVRRDDEQQGGQDEINNEGKLIVLGVNWNTSNEAFKAYFGKFGELLECDLVYGRDGQSRGFGFIQFKDMEVTKHVMRQTHELDGRRVSLRERIDMKKGPGDSRRRKVFVGRLPEGCVEDELKAYFAQFGRVSDVFMPVNKDTKMRKGCAFVEFESPDSAQAALAVPHNLRGSDMSIEIAEPRRPLYGAFGGPAAGGRGGGNPYERYGNFGAPAGGAPGAYGGYSAGGYGAGGRGSYGGGRGGGNDYRAAAAAGGYGQDYSAYGYGGAEYGAMPGADVYGMGGYGQMGAYAAYGAGYDARAYSQPGYGAPPPKGGRGSYGGAQQQQGGWYGQ